MVTRNRRLVADAIRLEGLSKTYGTGQSAVAALADVTLALPPGSFTAIMGPSGSGKSTLLQCASGLDRPTSGTVVLGGTDLGRLSETQLTRLRRDRVGFVFQAFNLVAALSVEQNILLPLRFAGRQPGAARLDGILNAMGLPHHRHVRPAQLSGGQQQRVAIARALITRPDIVFADEPTGSLDIATGREILALLRRAVDAEGQTVAMVTHDPAAACYAHRVVFLADGRIASTLGSPTPDSVAERMAHLGGAT